jgi:hypothetical protein
MPGITILSQIFYDENTGTGGGGVPYLLGSIGDKITTEIVFEAYRASEDLPLIISASESTITRTDTGSFVTDGWRIDETFDLSGTSDDGSYTVLLVSDKQITVVETFTTSSTYPSASMFSTPEPTSCDYFYGLIENDEPVNYFSKVDYETQQRFTASGISPTGSSAVMTAATNSKGWNYDGTGFATAIEGVSQVGYRRRYKITSTFLITPVAVRSWVTALTNGLPPAPEYFQDRKTLRHVFKIGLSYFDSDPDYSHDVEFNSRKGMTSWYGETLNGKEPSFDILGISYFDGLTASPVDAIQVTRTTLCEISIESQLGVFDSTTNFLLQAIWVNQNESDTLNTITSLRVNMANDRVLLSESTSPQNGINFGSISKWLTAVSVTVNNPMSASITFTSDIFVALQSRILAAGSENWKYLIAVTVQTPTITTTRSIDRVSMITAFTDFIHDYDETNLFQLVSHFFTDYPYGDQYTDINAYAGEAVVADSIFRVRNNAKLKQIGGLIRATHATLTPFTLKEISFDTSGYCIADSTDAQAIGISQATGYRVVESDPLFATTVVRSPSDDNVNGKAYRFKFPFKLRYEDWIAFAGANCDFPDATQDWSVYAAASGWSLEYILTGTVGNLNSVFDTQYERTAAISLLGAGQTGSSVLATITTLDETEAYDLEGSIYLDEKTTVRATFLNALPPPSGYSRAYVTLVLDADAIGGETYAYKFNTNDAPANLVFSSPWIGYPADEDPIFTDNSGSTLTAYARLDPDKLNAGVVYKLYGYLNYRI